MTVRTTQDTPDMAAVLVVRPEGLFAQAKARKI